MSYWQKLYTTINS